MILYMGSKTFLDDFINQDPKTILRTQYIIVSSKIRKTGKYEKQVIIANNILYPNESLIMDYNNYKDNEEYYYEYYKQLDECKPFLSHIILSDIRSNCDTVFLCAESELKFNYLKIISDYVSEEFRYKIYNYKKIKNRKIKTIPPEDYLYAKEYCKKIVKASDEKRRRELSKTPKGRYKLITEFTNKKLKEKLEVFGEYEKGMSRKKMIKKLNQIVNDD